MRWVGLVAMLALVGCQDDEEQAATDDPCNAAAYATTIGSNIAAVLFPAELNMRVIGPDTSVTMDFVPERLNVRLDADGTITALDCG
ncbi:MAG: I78 family peptidase inhibitor [Pseudomonadota bacterium]